MSELPSEIRVNAALKEHVFFGEFVHALDPKRRLTIPTGWRSTLGEGATLTVFPHTDGPHLRIYPTEELQRKLGQVRAMADRQNYTRQIGRVGDTVNLDTQGRVRIRDSLLNHAGLTEQVVLVGCYDRIEAWNPDAYRAFVGLQGNAAAEHEIDPAALKQFWSKFDLL